VTLDTTLGVALGVKRCSDGKTLSIYSARSVGHDYVSRRESKDDNNRMKCKRKSRMSEFAIDTVLG
jgi:hypothetical protein